VALLVLGKTRCVLCGRSIETASEAVAFPPLGSATDVSRQLSDAVAHRAHLLADPRAAQITELWREIADNRVAGARILARDDSRLLAIDDRAGVFRYFWFPRLIALEDESNSLRSFADFLARSASGADAAVELVRFTYSVTTVDGRRRLVVGQRPPAPRDFAVTSAISLSEPLIDEPFEDTEWADFAALESTPSQSP